MKQQFSNTHTFLVCVNRQSLFAVKHRLGAHHISVGSLITSLSTCQTNTPFLINTYFKTFLSKVTKSRLSFRCFFTPCNWKRVEGNEELRKLGAKFKYLHHKCSVPDTDAGVSLSHSVQTSHGVATASVLIVPWNISLWVKRPGPESNHTILSQG